MTSSYTTLALVKSAVRIADSVDDDLIQSVIGAASSRIDNACNRVFAQSTGDRYYVAHNNYTVPIDDLCAGLTVAVRTDDDESNAYASLWSSSSYQFEPLNNTVQGKPVRLLRAVGANRFNISTSGKAMIKITGTWGWPSVPPEISEATRLMVIRMFRRFDSPLGIAGFGDLGAVRVRSLDPDIQQLIQPFALVAVA